MAWLPAVGFVALFGYVHLRAPELADRPLSELRDGRWAVAGYTLFVLLLTTGVGQTAARFRAGGGRAAFVPGLAVGLLGYVALTPSQDADHALASFLLLGLVFIHFAAALYAAGSPWLFVHLAAPFLVVALVSDRPSFGRFQKGLILYFLLAATLDWLAVTGRLGLPGPDALRRKRRTKRAVAYRPRVEWRRYDGRPGRAAGSSL
jgi:hypothetical protein